MSKHEQLVQALPAELQFDRLNDALQIPDFRNQLAAVGVIALGAAATAIAESRFNHTGEKAALDFRGNGAMLAQSEIGAPEANKKQRIAPLKKAALGLTLLGVSQVAAPTYETITQDNESSVVVVSDVSSSMAYAKDLGGDLTRKQVVERSVLATDFGGLLGYVQSGAKSKTITAPTKDWEAQRAAIASNTVDPNGDSLSESIDQAVSALPKNAETGKVEGTAIIISDGTVRSTPEAAAAQAIALKEAGVTVKVIVPGTEAGTYRRPNTTEDISAATQPKAFAAYEDVTEAKTAEEVETAVQEAIEAAGERKEQNDYPYLAYAGWLILAAGGVQAASHIVSKRV